MKPDVLTTIAESLRECRRADLRDYEPHLSNPVEKVYVDPLPGDAVLKTVLSRNTTYLIGRKGTGKSTVFARAQAEMRSQNDILPVYLDVKALYDLISANEVPVNLVKDEEISEQMLRSHLLRKHFLACVVSDIISELKKAASTLKLWQRWTGEKRRYEEVITSLTAITQRVSKVELSQEEVPILRLMSAKTRSREQTKQQHREQLGVGAKLSALDPTVTSNAGIDDLEEALSDQDVYAKYSDAVLRSFPFASILNEIRSLLENVGTKRLVVFLDDFSELAWVDQQLFVDVVLAPLNNASSELVKLKIAAYPGRIYYGRIDPSKVDTLSLDFSVLYKAADIQTAEQSAIDYTSRLLRRRFEAFGEPIEAYFDSTAPIGDYMRLIFETTFNVPRLIGHLLHYAYLDRVSKAQPITLPSLRLASQKYYESVIAKYFDRMNRYALEPFDKKLDRHNQFGLLRAIVEEAKTVRRRIVTGQIGGTYFEGMSNPPVSHFTVTPHLERVLSSLELNFLVTKYHEMRNKDGQDVSVYALYYGLCEAERFPWGYPRGRRDDRSYFVQRCFDYTRTVHQFLSKNQTIRCPNCGACHTMDERDKFEFYKWRCPECSDGICQVINLGEEFRQEVQQLNQDIMLDPVELEILGALHDESRAMRAGEISTLLDITYQLAGKRTEKLRDMDLVSKETIEGAKKSAITPKATSIYFSQSGFKALPAKASEALAPESNL
jgi:hypothetical protein